MSEKKKHLSDWDKKIEEVFDMHLPNIGDLKREQIDTSGCFGDGTSLRLRLGLFYTNEEYEEYKKKVKKDWKKMMKKHGRYAKKLKRKEKKRKRMVTSDGSECTG